MTRTPTSQAVDEIPGRYDVADGGVYILIGDQEIAITSRRQSDPDITHESLLRAKLVVQSLRDGAEDALTELDAAIAGLGQQKPVTPGRAA